ncbi:hypothetical protein [Amycolatopsis minnesotensis]|uniref:Uncharacterized protein n=1 Tax=Amycolatopsis minnesotensis TaxID=337894 RepID=A0ABN2SI26_9PSEU
MSIEKTVVPYKLEPLVDALNRAYAHVDALPAPVPRDAVTAERFRRVAALAAELADDFAAAAAAFAPEPVAVPESGVS